VTQMDGSIGSPTAEILAFPVAKRVRKPKPAPKSRTAKSLPASDEPLIAPLGPPARWADRCPLPQAEAFARLALDTDNGQSPFSFAFETVVSGLDENDLERFLMAVWRLKEVAESEMGRRRLHGVLPRRKAKPAT
jgi:hypothetical protein